MNDTAKPGNTAHTTDEPSAPHHHTDDPAQLMSDYQKQQLLQRANLGTPEKCPTDEVSYFMVDQDFSEVIYIPVWFPGYGQLDITYESTPERDALGLKPVPVIRPRGEDFSPTDLVIKDEVGNLYEVVPRRKTKFNQPKPIEPMDLTEAERADFLRAGRELGHIHDDAS
jgi:hypothetical protein